METVRRVLTFLYLRDYHSPNPILRRQPSGIDSGVSEDFQSAYERHDDITDIEDDADDTDYADDMDTDDGTEPSEQFPSPTLSMMANEERFTVARGKSKAPNQIKDQIFPFPTTRTSTPSWFMLKYVVLLNTTNWTHCKTWLYTG